MFYKHSLCSVSNGTTRFEYSQPEGLVFYFSGGLFHFLHLLPGLNIAGCCQDEETHCPVSFRMKVSQTYENGDFLSLSQFIKATIKFYYYENKLA